MNTFSAINFSAAQRTMFALLAFFPVFPFQAPAQSSGALALTWNGYADTDLKFSEFYYGDHTIAVRFMPQYPYAYEGPFIAENGTGNFSIGQGMYYPGIGTQLFFTAGSNPGVSYPVKIAAGHSVTTGLLPGVWHHLALVATTSGSLRLFTSYIDGTQQGPPLTVLASEKAPNATLRLGKRTTGQTLNTRNAQFYGLLDDVAVFTRALSVAEIQSLSANAITGNESGLLAGYNFNAGNQSPRLNRPVTVGGTARIVSVSNDRNSAADTAALLLPVQQTEMILPFPPGEAWQVNQGYDDPKGSHLGVAAFCLDLIVAGKPQDGIYPNGSRGAPFYAAAAGPVIRVIQSGISGLNNRPNLIEVMQNPGEIAGYLHLLQYSSLVSGGNYVSSGQALAFAGDTGANINAFHLHFAVTDLPDQYLGFVTHPIAFSNYQVQDSAGHWTSVDRGVPQNGQIIRR